MKLIATSIAIVLITIIGIYNCFTQIYKNSKIETPGIWTLYNSDTTISVGNNGPKRMLITNHYEKK